MKHRMMEMTWPEIASALGAGCDTVIVTLGAVEQHGPHLPLGTDAYLGEDLGERIARKLGDALLAPALRLGCSQHHMSFPGSFTLRTEVFDEVLADYCYSLSHHSIRHVALIPTHGGNFAPLAKIVAQLRPKFPQLNIIAYTDLTAMMQVAAGVAARFGVSPGAMGAHAGQWETSVILALRPDLVALDQAKAGYTGELHAVANRLFAEGFKAVTENGVMGDPAGATAAAGEMYQEAMAEAVVDYIRTQRTAWTGHG